MKNLFKLLAIAFIPAVTFGSVPLIVRCEFEAGCQIPAEMGFKPLFLNTVRQERVFVSAASDWTKILNVTDGYPYSIEVELIAGLKSSVRACCCKTCSELGNADKVLSRSGWITLAEAKFNEEIYTEKGWALVENVQMQTRVATIPTGNGWFFIVTNASDPCRFDEKDGVTVQKTDEGLIVTLNEDIHSLSFPDNLGHVCLNLNGYNIFGANATKDDDGGSAVWVYHVDEGGPATQIEIENSAIGGGQIKGGESGYYVRNYSQGPDRRGGHGVEVFEDVRQGVSLVICDNVIVEGG